MHHSAVLGEIQPIPQLSVYGDNRSPTSAVYIPRHKRIPPPLTLVDGGSTTSIAQLTSTASFPPTPWSGRRPPARMAERRPFIYFPEELIHLAQSPLSRNWDAEKFALITKELPDIVLTQPRRHRLKDGHASWNVSPREVRTRQSQAGWKEEQKAPQKLKSPSKVSSGRSSGQSKRPPRSQKNGHDQGHRKKLSVSDVENDWRGRQVSDAIHAKAM